MTKTIKKRSDLDNMKIWSDLNRDFDLGGGVCASVTSHKSLNDKKGGVGLFYTNNAPKLKIKNQSLDIEYSSTEQEDNDLLHFLTSQTQYKK